jgi:outer membrane protein assembly factor BamE
MRTVIILFITSFGLSVTGCFNHDFTGRTKSQGNLLPDSKISRLRTGMSKREVAVIMGTSLVSPVFRTDRWDYVHTAQPANKEVDIKTVVFYFKHDRLQRIEKRRS